MATAAIDEIVTKVNKMTDTDRAELLRRLNRPASTDRPAKRQVANGNRRREDPNLTWIKANSDQYMGNYVALMNGELIAYGRTIKEADQAARAKGVLRPFLHYVLAEGEIAWGGW